MNERKEVPDRRAPGVGPTRSYPERIERFCMLLADINRVGGEECR